MLAVFAVMGYVEARTPRYLLTAAALIPLALVLDVLDGRVARSRQKHSAMGRELDSLADVISFGVAPAAIAYAAGMQRAVGRRHPRLLRLLRREPAGTLQRHRRSSCPPRHGKVTYFEGTPIPSSLVLVAVVGVAAWLGHIGRRAAARRVRLGPGRLHFLTLAWALSGSLMISKTLRIPKL